METETERPFPFVRNMTMMLAGEDKGGPLPFPAEYADWFFVGVFRHDDIFQDCNCKMLIANLAERAGRDSFRFMTTFTASDQKLRQSFVILDPTSNVGVVVARDCMQMHAEGENISDELYWQEVDVHLQRMWAGYSMPDRIDAVKRTNTPHHVILEERVSEEDHYDLWVHLYQDMSL